MYLRCKVGSMITKWSMCLVSQSCPTLQLHGLWLTRILCPWDFPGKNTGVGCHFLFQRLFLTQGSIPCLLHLLPSQEDSLLLSHLGSPTKLRDTHKNSKYFTIFKITLAFLLIALYILYCSSYVYR